MSSSNGAAPRPATNPEGWGARWTATRSRVIHVWKSFWTDPDYRWLRRLLLVGLLVRLVLAPITSWSIDTPSFILGDLGLVYTGSPYSSDLYFNPPLGPYLQAPLIWLVSLILGPNNLIQIVPQITPLAVINGLASPLVPVPGALVAEKLPQILADCASTVVLWILVRRSVGLTWANVAAAIWILNPALIWPTAVHGEVDSLAALFVLLFLLAAVDRRPLLSGAWLGLAVFAKGYPVALLPAAIAFWLLVAGSPSTTWTARLAPLGRFAAGLAIVTLPFVTLIPQTVQALSGQVSTTYYGGLSILTLYNVGEPHLPGAWGFWQTAQFAPGVLLFLRILAGIAIVGSVAALILRRKWILESRDSTAIPWLAAIFLWPTVGAVLSASVAQPEYIVVALGLMVVAWPVFARFGRSPYRLVTALGFGMLSAAAIGLYLALLTPAAYFYPGAVAIGPGAVDWINQQILIYLDSHSFISQGWLWLLFGLIGGIVLLMIWAGLARWLLIDRQYGSMGERLHDG